jgi:hypothetical protein
MVLDGYTTLQEALAIAQPKHPPTQQPASAAYRQGSLPDDVVIVPHTAEDTQHYQLGTAIFVVGLVLILTLRLRRSRKRVAADVSCMRELASDCEENTCNAV